ncbi:hypothetical protein HOY80DRAFT_269585 [Tuber brumale]|nr:hypothetical protein HOY80DRAFT_269585 [Tuber brumale]
MLDTLPENTSVDSGIGSNDGGSGSEQSAKIQDDGGEYESGATPSSLSVGSASANSEGKRKEDIPTLLPSTAGSQLLGETKRLARASKPVDGSVSSPTVLISAATSEEVQGHSDFNSWLSGFASAPAPKAEGKSDFSASLAKLKAAKGDREAVLAPEASGSGGWAQQVVPESIQKMLGTDMSDGVVHVIVKDLVNPALAKDEEKHVEEVLIPPEHTIFDLCEKIRSKGYSDIYGFKIHGGEDDFVIAPFTPKSTVTTLTVASGPSCYDLRKGYQINCDETLIKFFNRRHETKGSGCFNLINHGMYLSVGDTLRRVTIQFKRILRIPDDFNTYHLPQDVGSFNLFETSAFEKMPSSLRAKGGFFFPIYQREALCLAFSYFELASNSKRNDCQFAIKVYAGGVNALSGAVVDGEDELGQDYIVVPLQKWLGGFSTGPGEAKQFVPMPLGSGYTVENQLTGKENIGGIQLEIVPRYLDDCLFGKVSVGAENVKVDTEILEKASFDHFLTPRELGLLPGDRIYMQDLGETPYNYDFEYPDKEIGSLEGRTVVPKYSMKEERPTFVHELFIGDRTHRYDPRSSLVVTPIMAIPLIIIPEAAWGLVPFNLNCSPFVRIRDLSRAVQRMISGDWIVQVLEFPKGKFESDMAKTLHQIGISESVRVHVRGIRVTELRCGGAGVRRKEGSGGWDMGLAAGGRIKQTITKDLDPRVWNKADMKMVNIQMVNSVAFEAITGLAPPMPTVSFEDYAKAKIPYYIHDQANPAWIRRQFDSVSTVSEIDTEKDVEFLESLKSPGGTLVGCVCCERNMCDCVLDVCKHTFCHSCVEYYMVTNKKITCGLCNSPATQIIRFSASMSLRPSDNPQPRQIIGKPTTEMSLDSPATAPANILTPEQQAKLRNLLIHAIQADDVNAIMPLLRAGTNEADNSVLEKSIFWCFGTQCENNVVFDLLLAQVLADAQKAEKVNWMELMRVAVGRRNEHCIKRLAPLCSAEAERPEENRKWLNGCRICHLGR